MYEIRAWLRAGWADLALMVSSPITATALVVGLAGWRLHTILTHPRAIGEISLFTQDETVLILLTVLVVLVGAIVRHTRQNTKKLERLDERISRWRDADRRRTECAIKAVMRDRDRPAEKPE